MVTIRKKFCRKPCVTWCRPRKRYLRKGSSGAEGTLFLCNLASFTGKSSTMAPWHLL